MRVFNKGNQSELSFSFLEIVGVVCVSIASLFTISFGIAILCGWID